MGSKATGYLKVGTTPEMVTMGPTGADRFGAISGLSNWSWRKKSVVSDSCGCILQSLSSNSKEECRAHSSRCLLKEIMLLIWEGELNKIGE